MFHNIGRFIVQHQFADVLDVAGASRVTAPRALALSHTPKKPHMPADPSRSPSQRRPHWHGVPTRRSQNQRRPHPRQGVNEESARAAVANKSCCA